MDSLAAVVLSDFEWRAMELRRVAAEHHALGYGAGLVEGQALAHRQRDARLAGLKPAVARADGRSFVDVEAARRRWLDRADRGTDSSAERTRTVRAWAAHARGGAA